jgi:hypothetical protein
LGFIVFCIHAFTISFRHLQWIGEKFPDTTKRLNNINTGSSSSNEGDIPIVGKMSLSSRGEFIDK